MRFARHTRSTARRVGQDRSIVPMINVVFLLLIFFLMTASLTAPPPFDMTAPVSDAPLTDPRPDTLYISADGRLDYNGARNGDAMAAIARGAPAPLPVFADATLPATELAALLPDLAALGVTEVALRTVVP